jgi:transcriptional regulator with XRE-family HTH domain
MKKKKVKLPQGRPALHLNLVGKVKRLRKKGWSYRAIAEELGISISTAYRLENNYDYE